MTYSVENCQTQLICHLFWSFSIFCLDDLSIGESMALKLPMIGFVLICVLISPICSLWNWVHQCLVHICCIVIFPWLLIPWLEGSLFYQILGLQFLLDSWWHLLEFFCPSFHFKVVPIYRTKIYFLQTKDWGLFLNPFS